MIRGFFITAGLVVAALPAYGATPSDAVRFFYNPAHSETDPEFRDRFAGPALEKLEANQAVADDGELGCIDFALAYDAQDLDDAEVARTLAIEETVTGDTATVTASFTLFPTSPKVRARSNGPCRRSAPTGKSRTSPPSRMSGG